MKAASFSEYGSLIVFSLAFVARIAYRITHGSSHYFDIAQNIREYGRFVPTSSDGTITPAGAPKED
jgi:hypothetical protein